ncbi:MAG: 6-bladed beta-propeller [Nitrososphaeraceae archaeon]|nr:6-bladed beta-propeller [Nitrososphaeraceae archaeon]
MLNIILCALVVMTIALAITNYLPVFAQEIEEQYRFVFKWGSNGTDDGQFLRPHGIDFDSQGNVYVTDRDLNNIQKFTSDGKFLYKWGKKGDKKGEFKTPYSVILDKYDKVYVVDRDNNRIQKFDNNGKFIKMWNKFDIPRSTDNLLRPEAMAIDDSSGNIYITDTGNNRTIKLDDNFNFILEWGSSGKGEGEFTHPHGIGVDSSGNVYVNEISVPRIQKFDENGTFIKQWGSEGTGPGEFDLGLEHLYVDAEDNVWQVDGSSNPRVQKFDIQGNYITSVGSGPCVIPDEVKNDAKKMADYNKCDGGLHRPEHANVDSSGNLYVVDRGNQRIVVFSPIK